MVQETFYDKFKDAVLCWFSGLEDGQQKEVISVVLGDEYLDEEEYGTPYDCLESQYADKWFWENFGGYGTADNKIISTFDFLGETERIMTDMCWDEYDFTKDFISDIAYHCQNYSDPKQFFEDLAYGGCTSGMVGMFIYHNDCKTFYCEHITDMEDYKEELEGGLGEPISNKSDQPHYTFMCWLCYEEFARRLSQSLFND